MSARKPAEQRPDQDVAQAQQAQPAAAAPAQQSGNDFSGVQVHPNGQAGPTASALAYTQGQDVAFAPGQEGGQRQGQELLGHEAAHVVQQRQGDNRE